MEVTRGKPMMAEAFASIIREAHDNNPEAAYAHVERSMMGDSDSINPGVRQGRTLNKFGDVPNPANQRKAARRRRNRELRLEDPAVYREVMTAKKALRDEGLRAKGQ
ncbi:hypothetical protein KJ359_004870 [Pestalotiopsis sp. 9143b]|nr:hypothetical protein KJ359_004870 [Pestalotiopsis sp. 9143b]